MAISKNGIPAIGISLIDDMSDYVKKQEECFLSIHYFRQRGIASSFALHGKVECGAIGRMVDGSLYYFLTRDKESMYDFVDALIEYGVVDAMYITGGNGYEFYRDSIETAYVSASLWEKYQEKRGAPYLVFRNK